MTRSSGTVVFRFNPQKREPPRRNGLGCHKTERPGLAAPCMIVVCRICHASPARGVFQTADGFGCIAPQHRCPWRAGAYRRNSPSSLWEGVSKFHYPPRCPRARFASTGSKAALIARPACPSPPELAVVAAHLTSLSRGFRIGNTVYSVFKARKKTPLTYCYIASIKTNVPYRNRVIRRAILTVMTESLGIWRMIKDLLHILKWKN